MIKPLNPPLSPFFKGGIDLNSPLEREQGVCFLLGKLFNYKSSKILIKPLMTNLKIFIYIYPLLDLKDIETRFLPFQLQNFSARIEEPKHTI